MVKTENINKEISEESVYFIPPPPIPVLNQMVKTENIDKETKVSSEEFYLTPPAPVPVLNTKEKLENLYEEISCETETFMPPPPPPIFNELSVINEDVDLTQTLFSRMKLSFSVIIFGVTIGLVQSGCIHMVDASIQEDGLDIFSMAFLSLKERIIILGIMMNIPIILTTLLTRMHKGNTIDNNPPIINILFVPIISTLICFLFFTASNFLDININSLYVIIFGGFINSVTIFSLVNYSFDFILNTKTNYGFILFSFGISSSFIGMKFLRFYDCPLILFVEFTLILTTVLLLASFSIIHVYGNVSRKEFSVTNAYSEVFKHIESFDRANFVKAQIPLLLAIIVSTSIFNDQYGLIDFYSGFKINRKNKENLQLYAITALGIALGKIIGYSGKSLYLYKKSIATFSILIGLIHVNLLIYSNIDKDFLPENSYLIIYGVFNILGGFIQTFSFYALIETTPTHFQLWITKIAGSCLILGSCLNLLAQLI